MNTNFLKINILIWGKTKMNNDKQFENYGFVELDIKEGMTNGAAYTAQCSGGRSDCCTRVCSKDENFVGNAEEWEAFLNVEGGAVQY